MPLVCSHSSSSLPDLWSRRTCQDPAPIDLRRTRFSSLEFGTGPRLDCGCSAPDSFSVELARCRSTRCRSESENGWLAAWSPSSSPPPAAWTGGELSIQRNWRATSPRKPTIQSPILGAASPARRPDSHCRKWSRANKRLYAERPALVMSEASKIGRAPLVDLDAPACRRSPAQVRLPLVTQGGRFTAATFRS
jgi:hypothetical protein